MLLPDFKDLLTLENSANNLSKNLIKSSVNQLSGNYLSHFKGQGMEFAEVRAYSYGDDPRNIDWRVSARSDETYVKTFQEERQRDVMVVVDNNDYMRFGTKSTFKNVQAARIASLLSFAANKNSDKVGFYIFGNRKNRYEYFKPKSSKNSVLRGLKSLCDSKEYKDNYSLEGALFNLRRLDANPNIIFIISTFRDFSDELEKQLFFYNKKAQIVLVNILDDSDEIIPDVGRLVLKYGERRFLLNTSNKKGMETYRDNFLQKQDKLKKIASKVSAKIININTKDNPFKKLAMGLSQR